MDHILQLHEFFIEGGEQELSHVLLHITEPSTPAEMAKGYFFAICELNAATTAAIAELQKIIDTAENDYYEMEDDADKTSLEKVLEKINQAAPSILTEEVGMHCLLGVILKSEIIFTFYGEPQMVLFYKNKQGIYHKMDLVTHQADDDQERPDRQLFSHIIQGKISPHDYLFAGTPHINNYFSQDRLQKIITARPARQTAEHLERVLKEIRDGYSFGGVIIHLESPTANLANAKKSRVFNKGGSAKSLHNLFSTEKNTTDTLSPSLLPGWNEKLKSLFNKKNTSPSSNAEDLTSSTASTNSSIDLPAQIHAPHATPHRSRPGTEPKKTLIQVEDLKKIANFLLTGVKNVSRGFVWVLIAIYTVAYAFIRGIILATFVIFNYQQRRKSILEEWRRQWRGLKENIRNLPLTSKILFGGALILIIAVVGSIFYLKQHQKKLVADRAWQDKIQQLQTKRDAMDSAMLYKNETLAWQEYSAAKQILEQLTCSTATEKATCAQLAKDFEQTGARLRKMVPVTPQLIADWKSRTGAINFEGKLIRLKNWLVGYAPQTSTLFTYDLATKKSSQASTQSTINGFSKALVPKENDYLLFLSGKKDFLKVDPIQFTTKSSAIAFADPATTIVSGVIYNRRLYTLDAQHNQIYKHDTAKDGFGTGREWLPTTGASLKDAVDMTVDGDLWVLHAGGTIDKFTSGVKQPFSVQGLNPAFNGPGVIYTYNDVQNIYILETEHKRLVILNKNGVLVKQLMMEQLSKPTGLVVDETEGIAYIVDGTAIYKISIK